MFFGLVKLSVPERCYILHVRCIVFWECDNETMHEFQIDASECDN